MCFLNRWPRTSRHLRRTRLKKRKQFICDPSRVDFARGIWRNSHRVSHQARRNLWESSPPAKRCARGIFFPPTRGCVFFQDPAGGKKVPELIGLGKCLLGIWGGELAQAGTLGCFFIVFSGGFLTDVVDGAAVQLCPGPMEQNRRATLLPHSCTLSIDDQPP